MMSSHKILGEYKNNIIRYSDFRSMLIKEYLFYIKFNSFKDWIIFFIKLKKMMLPEYKLDYKYLLQNHLYIEMEIEKQFVPVFLGYLKEIGCDLYNEHELIAELI